MNHGFSLIEALVALVVLSVGLLGAAGLLIGGLRDQSLALRQGQAAALLADVAGRIRANGGAGAAYDTDGPEVETPSCDESAPCDPVELASLDRAHFSDSARALLPQQRPRTRIEFEPAIGPAAADRYVISMTWIDAREPDATDEATLILLAQPVAGEP